MRQIVITNRAEGQVHLYRSTDLEVVGIIPAWLLHRRPRRVRHRDGMPVWLAEDRYAPRRRLDEQP